MLVVAPAEVAMASEQPPSKRPRVALPSSAPGVYVARRFVSGAGVGSWPYVDPPLPPPATPQVSSTGVTPVFHKANPDLQPFGVSVFGDDPSNSTRFELD